MSRIEREPILKVEDISVYFKNGKKTVHAVNHVSFDIFKGETFSLVGESGSGKTTIGRAIVRLNQIQTGRIIFQNEVISGKISRTLHSKVVRKVQMIFQDPMASLNERAKVNYIISEGLINSREYKNQQELDDRVHHALLDVGLLPEFASRFPHEFSGGQRQRIGIARALIMKPDFIVADEPISALDVSIRAQVLNLLNKFKRERGLSYLFIAHDLSVVRFISDRIAVIYAGKIVELADAERLFQKPLHPYTKNLLSAAPVPDPRLAKSKVVTIYDPTQHDYSKEKPTFSEIEPGHFVYGNVAELEKYSKEL
ncbi:MAG: ATP-binding cassette domain-containing protein [Clostridiales bacterium]|jgi:oligopeptide transport system ATP-binding protein|nr:ATP-binding cassette domain-containing protein [Clostridiales bacterium]